MPRGAGHLSQHADYSQPYHIYLIMHQSIFTQADHEQDEARDEATEST